MMAPPLYASLLGGWLVLAQTALLVTGGTLALRGLLAVVLLVLCGVGSAHFPDMARIMTGCGPALALCVWVFGPSRAGENASRGGDMLPFFLSGIAALAMALGRCDLLVALLGCGLVARLGLAIGPRGLDRDGWQVLRMGLGGLLVAQGGLFVLQADWGHMQDQAGAILLVGGLLLACGVPGRPGMVAPGWNMEALAVLPVVAQAARIWPVLLPALTFMGCVCLSWAVLSRRGRSFLGDYWAGWAVLAAGLPGGGMGGLPLAASLLAMACVTPSDGRLPWAMLWPPALPGMAIVLVLVGEMGNMPPVALLAGASLWPVMAACPGAGPGRPSWARAALLLAIGCVVLACAGYDQMGGGSW
ncbi:hypothetical protein [Komagataeibacter swingsii]|uniref:Uncharacterized protein n=1 Tax=Komagataeibacter swingsii TaxID=215220 RepID=A0A2V4S7M7_9PROT|nr:hypothetical protein [Komagataeibacter swingsii]PYD71285.1 hypothetical protein CFR76_00990 [Komagataeibacter swingsii]GBQ62712.1 hypothetical protein AA16373_2499 [Komagataeibacter swingsii DSM 16373]